MLLTLRVSVNSKSVVALTLKLFTFSHSKNRVYGDFPSAEDKRTYKLRFYSFFKKEVLCRLSYFILRCLRLSVFRAFAACFGCLM